MDVSVVIPAFNAAQTLSRAVSSVRSQSRPVREIIVVDDGSRDHTRELASSLGCTVHSQQNAGPSAARNAGIELSRGELVAFLDADDHWAAHKLERQLEAIEETGAPGVCSLAAEYDVGTPPPVLRASPGPLPPLARLTFRRLLRGNAVVTSSVLVRRSALDALGTAPFPTHIPAAEDWCVWLRLAARSPLVRLEEPLVIYERAPASQGRRFRPEQYRAFYDAVLVEVRRDPVAAARLDRRTMVSARECGVARLHAGLGEAREARRVALGVLRARPTDPLVIAEAAMMVAGPAVTRAGRSARAWLRGLRA